MRMKRHVLVGVAALAVGAVLQTGADRFASLRPVDWRIAQQEIRGTPTDPEAPSGPYVQQHLDNQEGGAPGSNS